MAKLLDVLIIDDDPMITRALTRVIRHQHVLRLAENLTDAMACIEKRPPDVVLCDFLLGSLTATDFLRTVRARWPGIRLVLHSGSRPDLWRELVADGTVDCVVAKPATVQDLVASLVP